MSGFGHSSHLHVVQNKMLCFCLSREISALQKVQKICFIKVRACLLAPSHHCSAQSHHYAALLAMVNPQQASVLICSTPYCPSLKEQAQVPAVVSPGTVWKGCLSVSTKTPLLPSSNWEPHTLKNTREGPKVSLSSSLPASSL